MKAYLKQLTKNLPKLISFILVLVIVAGLLFYGLTALATLKGQTKPSVPEESTEETDPPETEETPETTTTEAPTTTEPTTESTTEEETEPREIMEIKSLSQSDIDELVSSYDGTVHRYIIGYDNVETDANNRPVYANDLLSTFDGTDARVKVFSAGEDSPKAAFSFMLDDEAPYTEQVLDILKEQELKAVFFVTHTFAANHADLVKRMIEEGHEVGNHSYTYPENGAANMEPLDQVFEAFNMHRYMDLGFDYNMQRYCFSKGYWSQLSVMLMSRMGYEVCFSSSNFEDDNSALEYDPAAVLLGLEKNLHNGCIYSFHLSNEIVPAILPDLIDFIKEQGFRIIQM